LTEPLVRENGVLRPASWDEALDRAAAGHGSIVNVTSPADHSVTHGHLCIKGRFGFQHVQNLPPENT
jgi:predicted molibdopterin-dependent oxidoreductase YjgC